MKQVNVLMDEELVEHVEKLSQMVSFLAGKKVTTSDVIRKSVVEYTKYGLVVVESKSNEQEIMINLKPATVEGYKDLPNDDLMQKIINTEW